MDRYAQLRENLVTYRAMTAHTTVPSWCGACERHLADESGLCPMCPPALLAPASEGTPGVAA